MDDAAKKTNAKELFSTGELRIIYSILLILTSLIFITGILVQEYEDVIIAAPILFILIDALFFEREKVVFPPVFIYLFIALMFMILITRRFGDALLFSIPSDFLFGIILGLTGLMTTYTLLKAKPEVRRDNPFITSFVSSSVGISTFAILSAVVYYLDVISGKNSMMISELMKEFVVVTIGIAFVSFTFYFNRNNGLFKHTVDDYLSTNAGIIGIDQYECDEIRKAIDSGESENVEFKSTLRTNLESGEKDVRMETAVLKTLVAFMNTEGGTLLIGVGDEGEITGIDESNFENRDKLNLHMTNLIKSRIGNDFLNYISFRLTD